MNKLNFLLLTFFVVLPSLVHSKELITDIGELTEENRLLYEKIESNLDAIDNKEESVIEAGELIEQFLKRQSEFAPVYVERARYLIKNSYYVRKEGGVGNKHALEVLLELSKKAPNYPKVYVLLGHVYTNLGQYDVAERVLLKAQKIGTNDPWLYNNLSTLYYLTKRYDEANTQAVNAIENSQDNGNALVSAVMNFQKSKIKINTTTNKLDLVEQIFTSFTEANKRLEIARGLISLYNSRSGQLQIAFQIIDRQQKETPNCAKCKLILSELILRSGYISHQTYFPKYTDRSMLAAEKVALELKGTGELKADAIEILLLIAFSREDYNRAKKLIDESKSTPMLKTRIIALEAELLFATNKFSEAVDKYGELEQIEPDLVNRQILAASYNALGDDSLLESYHKKKIESSPKDPWVLGNFVVFLNEKHRFDEAIEIGERALKITSYPVLRQNLGLAYLYKAFSNYRSSDFQSAKVNYDNALRIAGDRDVIHRESRGFDKSLNVKLNELNRK
jgi:Flp pilus assembly protein TadD